MSGWADLSQDDRDEVVAFSDRVRAAFVAQVQASGGTITGSWSIDLVVGSFAQGTATLADSVPYGPSDVDLLIVHPPGFFSGIDVKLAGRIAYSLSVREQPADFAYVISGKIVGWDDVFYEPESAIVGLDPRTGTRYAAASDLPWVTP